jgi:tetratricopeptide (TPR) repeat protein
MGATQQELAERSALTRFPFDRTFVAHVESGNAPPSTARFLSYLSLLHADPNTVLKLVDVAIEHESVPMGLEYLEYLHHAKRCHVEGKWDEAINWLFVGLRRAEEGGDKVWAAKLKIGASIVLRSQRAILLARRMAEEALNCLEIDDGDRVRAAIMVSQTCRYAEDYQGALAYLLLAASIKPAGDELLSTQLAQTRAGLALTLNQHAEAATYYEICVSGYERLGIRNEEANARSILSKVYWTIGKRSQAINEMKLALATIRRWPDRRYTVWVLAYAGWLAMERKQFIEARKLLLEAELRAKDLAPPCTLVVIRTYLLDLALRTGDAPLRHFMKAFLLRKARDANLDPEDRGYVDEVLRRLESETSDVGQRKPKKQ